MRSSNEGSLGYATGSDIDYDPDTYEIKTVKAKGNTKPQLGSELGSSKRPTLLETLGFNKSNYSFGNQPNQWPYNSNIVQLPHAIDPNLTPRKGWQDKLNDAERALLVERSRSKDLEILLKERVSEIDQLKIVSRIELEQMLTKIDLAEREKENLQAKLEQLKNSVGSKDEIVEILTKANEENQKKYSEHLHKVKLEYEKLLETKERLTHDLLKSTQENEILKRQESDIRNELGKVQGIRSSEKELLSKTIDDLRYEIKEVRERQATTSVNYEKAKASEISLQNALKKAKEEYAEIKIAKDTLEARINSTNRDIEGKVNEKLQRIKDSHHEELSKLQTNYRIEQEVSQKLTQQITNFSEQLTQARNANASLRDDNDQLKERISRFQYSEKEFKSSVEGLKTRYDTHFDNLNQDMKKLTLERFHQQNTITQLQQALARSEQDCFQMRAYLKIYKKEFELRNLTVDNEESLKGLDPETVAQIRDEVFGTLSLKNKLLVEKSLKIKNDRGQQKTGEIAEATAKFGEKMDSIGGGLEKEWSKLFDEIDGFRNKIEGFE